HGIIARAHERVRLQRVGNQNLARYAPITRQHDEMPHRLAAHVVNGVRLGDLAHGSVEVGGAQARDHGDAALQELAQQRRLEIAQHQAAAEPQELVVAARRRLQPLPGFALRLRREARADLVVRQIEPGGVEEIEVVGVDRDVIAARERVVGKEHVERAAALAEHADVGDDVREQYVVAVVAIDAVETGGAARDVVGLLLDDKAEPGSGGPCGQTFALVLGARQGVTKASCRSRPARSRPSRTTAVAAIAARCAALLVGEPASWACAAHGRPRWSHRRRDRRPTRNPRRSGFRYPPRRIALWAYAWSLSFRALRTGF